MASNKLYMYAFFVTGLLCIAWALSLGSVHEKSQGKAKATAAALDKILSEPKPTAQGKAGNDIHADLRAANDSYLDVDLRDSKREVPAVALLNLARCMRSGPIEVRSHCQELSLTMLSDWTFHRPESEWHSKPEVDAFFRVFKASNYAELEIFLSRRPLNYEQKYLNQI